MNIFYDSDRDYAEVFFKKIANYAEELNTQVTAFKSEKTNKIVGYGFEDATHSLFEFSELTPAIKLATLLRILRSKEGLTQDQVSKKIGSITFRHYQRLESGEENPTLETIAGIMAAFPDADFSVILKSKSRAA